MRPTRARDLIAVAVAFGVLGYLLLWWAYRSIPTLPRTASVSVLMIGAIELQVASLTRRRLEGRPGTRPILPLTVARLAALAKASSVVGAALAGIWAGVFGYTMPRTGEFPTAGGDALTAGLGLAAAMVLLTGGLILERVCRVKKR
ncbi:hypothetical protein ThrDRAFT_01234 [Frankia casuarinae]|uniref:DUF3180 domain-containing protein n=1 Tax=Frankia casuarinae (strain DSM 45818 / CECT 9043 / HFP020203 / CcI3) TaxID=106370 RepID=Q2J4P2_FRACC|nr:MULTISPECIES: DUF3180 domain-containing protein [Frankia]ABD13750.1 conserved hypothetical protein [Frankia casuarinae]ETA02663.1 hypothetical protein CcI6DRAFT_01839 [Frankia sp. CcI6]EYT93049.1 hypothetical protein ThrDRAFT_01234 [Frankia casuarinae]KDA44127.1 hypothetical protein BMG523Draft_00925 [Frankia sp. BMG5.23]KFB07005.1 Protein of unknown function (DUF3180) [Frankia sp. Allo2]